MNHRLLYSPFSCMCIVTCTCIQYMNLIFFISAAFIVYIQVCGCICIFHMHWKQSGRGVGNMTASLACSGCDLAHHLPAGSSSLTTKNRLFFFTSPSCRMWIGIRSKESMLKLRGRPGTYSQNKGSQCQN